MSYNRRKLEMTRTLQAQSNHQSNFMAKQFNPIEGPFASVTSDQRPINNTQLAREQ